MSVRRFRAEDLTVLHEANQASVPGVSGETMEDLSKWIALSTCFVATDEMDQPLGFLTLIELGKLAYPSDNLRWFETYAAQDRKSVIYVDRIALLPEARGKRLGEALYQAAFSYFSELDEIGCEINNLPPNPGSHRFHQRLGFHQIGGQIFVEGEKSVAYYVRALS